MRTVAALLLLPAVGCGGGVGSASVTGTLGPLALEVSGTVIAVPDSTEIAFEQGVLTRRSRAPAPVRIHLFEAVFDPRDDLRFLPLEDRQALGDDLVKGARVTVVLADSVQVGAGPFQGDRGLAQQSPEGVEVTRVRFGTSELDGAATYPETVVPAGSSETWTLTFGASSTAPGDTVRGTLDLVWDRADFDPDEVLTGTVRIEFEAEVLPERIGECNESSDWGQGPGTEPECGPA